MIQRLLVYGTTQLDGLRTRAFKKLRAPITLGVITGVVGILLSLTPAAVLEELVGLSLLFRIRGLSDPPTEVFVVAIDRATPEQLELPSNTNAWPRSVHAELIDRLVQRGVSIIAVDLDLVEPRAPAEDSALATAIERANRVVLVERIERETIRVGPPEMLKDQLLPPIAAFSEAAIGLAPFPLPKVPARVAQFWAFRRHA